MTNIQKQRQRFEVMKAAFVLEDFLYKNVGDTADWPIHLHVDNLEDAKQLAELLGNLRKAIKPIRENFLENLTKFLEKEEANTFEKYLDSNIQNGVIDFNLRVELSPDVHSPRLRFYIYPATTSGETKDYFVEDNDLRPIVSEETEERRGNR